MQRPYKVVFIHCWCGAPHVVSYVNLGGRQKSPWFTYLGGEALSFMETSFKDIECTYRCPTGAENKKRPKPALASRPKVGDDTVG